MHAGRCCCRVSTCVLKPSSPEKAATLEQLHAIQMLLSCHIVTENISSALFPEG